MGLHLRGRRWDLVESGAGYGRKGLGASVQWEEGWHQATWGLGGVGQRCVEVLHSCVHPLHLGDPGRQVVTREGEPASHGCGLPRRPTDPLLGGRGAQLEGLVVGSLEARRGS